MNCKSCDNGLTKEEEENDQCNDCIRVEIDLEENDKHCPSCSCNDGGYKPKGCPCCNAQVFCMECTTEV